MAVRRRIVNKSGTAKDYLTPLPLDLQEAKAFLVFCRVRSGRNRPDILIRHSYLNKHQRKEKGEKIMSLYKQWTDMVVEYVKTKGEAAFWNEYTKIETAIYRDLLANSKEAMKITIADFAKKYETSEEFIMGFVDGINESLNNQYDLEALTSNDEIVLDINLEKLFFNMLEAKAEYLYNLPQWDAIFSPEKRREIQKAYRESCSVRNENKVGRNDACPCGSGKKYKKCCGK